MNRRTKVYVLILIWLAIFLQLIINASIDREKRMVEQVMSEDINNLALGTVKAYSYYGSDYISVPSRESMVKNLAKKLGINSGYEVTSKKDEQIKNEVTTLNKYGQQADTQIKVITLYTTDKYEQPTYENYILVEINLKASNGTTAYEFNEKLKNIYAELGMEANTNIYLLSQEKGELIDSELDAYIDRFLEETGAVEVDRTEFDVVICIYGYSNDIDEFVYQNNERVNVNIAFSYDASEDITYIHRAIPFVDKSF